MLKAKKHTFPPLPTEDPEVTALTIGTCRVGRQAEVVAGILGEDWLDPQGTLRQNLKPGTQGGVAMDTGRPASPYGGAGPLVVSPARPSPWSLAFGARVC